MSVKITLNEILMYPGFDIPSEGIGVNENDMFLHAESLSLIEKTISVDSINDERLTFLRDGLAGLCAAHGVEVSQDPTPESLIKLRTLISASSETTYRYIG